MSRATAHTRVIAGRVVLAAIDDEAADVAVAVLVPRPHQHQVRDRAIADPALGPVEGTSSARPATHADWAHQPFEEGGGFDNGAAVVGLAVSGSGGAIEERDDGVAARVRSGRVAWPGARGKGR